MSSVPRPTAQHETTIINEHTQRGGCARPETRELLSSNWRTSLGAGAPVEPGQDALLRNKRLVAGAERAEHGVVRAIGERWACEQRIRCDWIGGGGEQQEQRRQRHHHHPSAAVAATARQGASSKSSKSYYSTYVE